MVEQTGLTDQQKGQELKLKLLECLRQENRELMRIAKEYFEKPNKSESDAIHMLEAVIESSDHILTAGDWDSSLFLRNQVKSVKAIKAEAEAELQKKLQSGEKENVQEVALEDDEMPVYISLFQSDGYNVEKWAVQLRALKRYVVGRPIYEDEAHVQARIRLRAAAANEGYVIVGVKKADIKQDPFAPVMKDQYQHPLLNLKDTAVQNGKIVAFVHQNKRYIFHEGELIESP